MTLDNKQIKQFISVVWSCYMANRRDLPWRRAEANGTFDPYKIFVSEVMLQQTQVSRVVPKYEQFIARFSDVEVLATSSFKDVLTVWNGLGYNRRAKFLLMTAQKVMEQYQGVVPDNILALQEMPGIGHNTAAAICTYAFNQQHAFYRN